MSSFLYENILSLINQLDNASDTFYMAQKLASRVLDANASLRGLRPSTPQIQTPSTGLMVPTTRHVKARLPR